MEQYEYNPPTGKEIEQAQLRLNFEFTKEYVEFIKSGYDLGDSTLEALEICSPNSHVDIYSVNEFAKGYSDIPEEGLIICEDNGDYFYLMPSGLVRFWSHNGFTDEAWADVSAWVEAMKAEADQ